MGHPAEPCAARPVGEAARVVRGFARYANAADPRHQVPPQGLIPYRYRRPQPYIYGAREIADLIAAAQELPGTTGLRPFTYGLAEPTGGGGRGMRQLDAPPKATVSTGGASRGQPGPRTAVLLHTLDARNEPCVLALDELECVANPHSVGLIAYLLRHAPASLHLALAYRRLPRGLDAAERLLAGSAQLVTAADLRFSPPDIARFFDLSLSRRELARVATASGGWPIALQIHRNAPGEQAAVVDHLARDAVANWIDGRFWRGFAPEDRDLALDLALFDWLDGELVEEVLEQPGALERAVRLPGLAGLLRPSPGVRAVYSMHPVLREHCAEQRRRTDPGRWRRLRRRLAKALARRGAVVEAMRHAAAAADPDLAGRILLDAGGVQWWLAESHDRLVAATAASPTPRWPRIPVWPWRAASHSS